MSQSSPTVHERLAVLEERSVVDRQKLNEINGKLDDLLALRDKGMGAFWLASALLGVLFAVMGSTVVGWFK